MFLYIYIYRKWRQGLRRLSGQPINHQICLKHGNMILLAINYHIAKKKSNYFIFKIWSFSSTFIQSSSFLRRLKCSKLAATVDPSSINIVLANVPLWTDNINLNHIVHNYLDVKVIFVPKNRCNLQRCICYYAPAGYPPNKS